MGMVKPYIYVLIICFINIQIFTQDIVIDDNLKNDSIYFQALTDDEVLNYSWNSKKHTVSIYASGVNHNRHLFDVNNYIYGQIQFSADQKKLVIGVTSKSKISNRSYSYYFLDGVEGKYTYFFDSYAGIRSAENLDFFAYSPRSESYIRNKNILKVFSFDDPLNTLEVAWNIGRRIGGGLSVYRIPGISDSLLLEYAVEGVVYAQAKINIQNLIITDIFNNMNSIVELSEPRVLHSNAELGVIPPISIEN